MNDKELLLKDLCSRLPCEVKCEYDGKMYDILGYAHGRIVLCEPFMSKTECPLFRESYSNIKPYLFPMSSMTDEQKNEYYFLCDECLSADTCEVEYFNSIKSIDWLNANHFDYRGLIEKGLALNATGLNIY